MHVLVLDGAYTFTGECSHFHRGRPPTVEELERLLETLIRRIMRTLVRSGALVVETQDDATSLCLAFDEEGEDALTWSGGAHCGTTPPARAAFAAASARRSRSSCRRTASCGASRR